uniref:Uncharacterized protein n=1 Tax=Candidatus Kentrum sp. DK TaxID=2126562 RepID=A0A450SPS8_9GAMM|nr:MAG: hypothetical protein BECKDK2373C_GA0170839_105025 [Candidatus Kentron sp. DK]
MDGSPRQHADRAWTLARALCFSEFSFFRSRRARRLSLHSPAALHIAFDAKTTAKTTEEDSE